MESHCERTGTSRGGARRHACCQTVAAYGHSRSQPHAWCHMASMAWVFELAMYKREKVGVHIAYVE